MHQAQLPKLLNFSMLAGNATRKHTSAASHRLRGKPALLVQDVGLVAVPHQDIVEVNPQLVATCAQEVTPSPGSLLAQPLHGMPLHLPVRTACLTLCCHLRLKGCNTSSSAWWALQAGSDEGAMYRWVLREHNRLCPDTCWLPGKGADEPQ